MLSIRPQGEFFLSDLKGLVPVFSRCQDLSFQLDPAVIAVVEVFDTSSDLFKVK